MIQSLPNISMAHVLVSNMRQGDAVSNHTFSLVRCLRDAISEVRVLYNHPNGAIPEDISTVAEAAQYADYFPNADLTVLQYPIWFPLAERFRQASHTALFWYHGVTPPTLEEPESLFNILLQTSQIRTELAWHAHLAVAASPFGAQELHGHSGYPSELIRVVPLAVDIESFAHETPENELASLRKEWRLNNKRILLFIGRIANNKRIDLLIEAMARLKCDHPDLHLLIVGGEENSGSPYALSEQLQSQIASLGLVNNVTFTGRVPAVEPYLHLADIYVSASEHEGFGVPLVEAMAAGIPVVASASGAMPWVLGADNTNLAKSGPAGILFQPGDVQDLSRAIGRILVEPDLRESLLEAARQRVVMFSPERFRTNVLKVVEEAAVLSSEALPPIHEEQDDLLHQRADIAIRSYRVRSDVPHAGRLIEWTRRNLTSHVKEPYLDIVIERQVNYNRLVVAKIKQLRAEIQLLRQQLAEKEAASDADRDAKRSIADFNE